MKKLIPALFVGILGFALLILPSVSEAQGRFGVHGGGRGYSGGHGGGSGYHGGYYGGHYRGHYHWGYHRGHYTHWGFGFYWGFPIVGWPYWGWPYYPPVAIEAPALYSAPGEQPPYYWYYCQDPQGYYPYVKSCPSGWIRVVPKETPPSQ